MQTQTTQDGLIWIRWLCRHGQVLKTSALTDLAIPATETTMNQAPGLVDLAVAVRMDQAPGLVGLATALAGSEFYNSPHTCNQKLTDNWMQAPAQWSRRNEQRCDRCGHRLICHHRDCSSKSRRLSSGTPTPSPPATYLSRRTSADRRSPNPSSTYHRTLQDPARECSTRKWPPNVSLLECTIRFREGHGRQVRISYILILPYRLILRSKDHLSSDLCFGGNKSERTITASRIRSSSSLFSTAIFGKIIKYSLNIYCAGHTDPQLRCEPSVNSLKPCRLS